MIEAWFYADNESLKTASVLESHLPPLLREGIDLEAFETSDPAFSADDGSGCTELKARNARRALRRRRPACFGTCSARLCLTSVDVSDTWRPSVIG
jgi:hypothetical protein